MHLDVVLKLEKKTKNNEFTVNYTLCTNSRKLI